MTDAEPLDTNDKAPEPPTPWSPRFCALAMGLIGMNISLVTVVPLVGTKPLGFTVIWHPFDAVWRATVCLGVGFVLGACVGLVAGFLRRATAPANDKGNRHVC
jgi:hypothetical protein